MLTEHEVSRSWHRLFAGQQVTPEILSKAEELLDELRAESPLRHRLSTELDEIRSLHAKAENKATKTRKPRKLAST